MREMINAGLERTSRTCRLRMQQQPALAHREIEPYFGETAIFLIRRTRVARCAMDTCSTPFIKSLPNDDPPHSCTQVRRVEEPVGLVVTKGTPLAHGRASEGGPIFAVSLRGAEITRVAEVGEITGAREQRCPVTYQT